MCLVMAAEPAERLDRLLNVVSVEWAGKLALVYTKPDAHGRPCQVLKIMFVTVSNLLSQPVDGASAKYGGQQANLSHVKYRMSCIVVCNATCQRCFQHRLDL